MTTSTVDGDEPPLKRRLRRMIDLRGLEPVSRELGIGRQSLACYLARIPLQRGTFELIERKLNELEADEHCGHCGEPRRKCACEDPAIVGYPEGGNALPR